MYQLDPGYKIKEYPINHAGPELPDEADALIIGSTYGPSATTITAESHDGAILGTAQMRFTRSFPEVALRIAAEEGKRLEIAQRLLRSIELSAGKDTEGLEILVRPNEAKAEEFCKQLGFTALFKCVRMVKSVEPMDMSETELDRLTSNIALDKALEPITFKRILPYDQTCDNDYEGFARLLRNEEMFFPYMHSRDSLYRRLHAELYDAEIEEAEFELEDLTMAYERFPATEIYVAKKPDGDVAATFQIDYEGDTPRVHGIVIAEEYRGHGLLDIIQKIVDQMVSDEGKDSVEIYVDEGKDRLIGRYQSLGYAVTDILIGMAREKSAIKSLMAEAENLGINDTAVSAAFESIRRKNQAIPEEDYKLGAIMAFTNCYQFDHTQELRIILLEQVAGLYPDIILESSPVEGAVATSLHPASSWHNYTKETDDKGGVEEFMGQWVNIADDGQIPIMRLVEDCAHGYSYAWDKLESEVQLPLDGRYAGYDKNSGKMLFFEVADGRASRLEPNEEQQIRKLMVSHVWIENLSNQEQNAYIDETVTKKNV